MTTKSIFITGGGSGIGRATAELFARRGWRVGVADVNPASLAATAQAIGDIATFKMDVRDRDTWTSSLDAFTKADGGALGVLMNNAGIGNGGALAQASFEDIDRIVAINFMGVLNGARIGHAYLAKAKGCLVNTASASAIYGSAGLATYSAAKFAVRGLTEALDGEWAPDGIRVRAIFPSFIETPLLDTLVSGHNRTIREWVVDAGLELTSVGLVAEAVWAAVHGNSIHTYIGRTSRRMAFAARWLPSSLRKRMRSRRR